MRILYHHRTLGDGAEGIHIRAMVDAFRELGHEVRVAGLADDPERGHRGRIVERGRSMLPRGVFELASIGVNVAEYVQMRRDIARYCPDLVYKRHARHDIAALTAARHCDVPVVLEVNALFTVPPYEAFEPLSLRTVARYLERRALDLATVVIAVSSPLAEQVKALGRPDVGLLPNGADPIIFDPFRRDREQLRVRFGLGRGLIVGWAGIVREWHGLQLLLEAAAQIPSIALLVIGDGPSRLEMEERAKELGLAGRLVVTGRVPHASMPDHLAALDIAVVPDERTGVASPMKLVEYMAMGLPVVAPDLANIRDLVAHDIDGMLFRSGDARDLSHVLERLAKDPGLRIRLGSQARAKVERERNWRRNARIVLETVTRIRTPSFPR